MGVPLAGRPWPRGGGSLEAFYILTRGTMQSPQRASVQNGLLTAAGGGWGRPGREEKWRASF